MPDSLINIFTNYEFRLRNEQIPRSKLQKIETEYWIKYVMSLIQEHYSETNSKLSKKIIDNFKNEI